MPANSYKYANKLGFVLDHAQLRAIKLEVY